MRYPISIQTFETIRNGNYVYVDKTDLVYRLAQEHVCFLSRPRRFGKTLTMDMLRTFFEKTQEDTSLYFKNKKIWQCGEYYRSFQGKYPVIFLTFKDVKFNTWAETFASIRELIAREAYRHLELQESAACDALDKKNFGRLLAGNASATELSNALADLSIALHKHHGIAPIIIIDEYDVPIQQGYMQGFYDDVILFMRNLFSGGLKDNKHLSYGFLTGILRVAKESIFSGLNNLSINSILDDKYSAYFGFTGEEVKQMAAYYGVADKYQEICDWYDGYQFGRTEIFNPWSVINYFSNNCQQRAFWQATGSNDIIGDIISVADKEIYTRLTSLVNGKTFTTYIDTGVIYPQIKNNPASIYSFLLVAGYLKAVKTEPSMLGDFMCEVAIPNKEIAYVYKKEILQSLEKIIPLSMTIAVQEALYSGDSKKLKQLMTTLLQQSVSSFDTAGENFYHGFVLGLCSLLSGVYTTSNRESGKGRYDIQLQPEKKNIPGILIELKAEKNATDEKLKKLADTALRQIKEKNYDAEMLAHGVCDIYKYGVAFSGKKVEVSVE